MQLMFSCSLSNLMLLPIVILFNLDLKSHFQKRPIPLNFLKIALCYQELAKDHHQFHLKLILQQRWNSGSESKKNRKRFIDFSLTSFHHLLWLKSKFRTKKIKQKEQNCSIFIYFVIQMLQCRNDSRESQRNVSVRVRVSGGPQRDRLISPGWFTPVLAQKLDEALQNAVVTTTQPFIVCPIVCVFTVWVWANHNQGHPQGGRNDGTWEGCKKEQEGGKEAESGGKQETGRQWWMSTIHPWSITHPPIIYPPIFYVADFLLIQ